MSLAIRYAWSTRFVREELRTGKLSEGGSFMYFWVIMVFDWLQFTLIATTSTGGIEVWSGRLILGDVRDHGPRARVPVSPERKAKG